MYLYIGVILMLLTVWATTETAGHGRGLDWIVLVVFQDNASPRDRDAFFMQLHHIETTALGVGKKT